MQAKYPNPFIVFCQKTIPLAFDESMSYMEALYAFKAYLENEIVPTVNTNGQAVQDLTNLVNQLQDYVEHYFDNLDVQEEINNKLDEMAENGQLTQLIAQFLTLNAIMSFPNVSSLKNADNLVNGSTVETYGFYNIGDKGGAKYYIRTITNEDVIDEKTIIALNNFNDLIAELTIESEMNIKQFGAKGDGDNDDTIAIQTAVDFGFNHHITIKVPSSPDFYKVTKPIILNNIEADTPTGEYYAGRSNKLIGENLGDCRIVKIGTLTHSSTNAFINGVNATIICAKNTANSGTGIYLENLCIENYETYDGDDTYTRITNSYGICTNVARSQYKNLTIISYYGMSCDSTYMCLFDNINIFAIEKSFYMTNGTANTLRFINALTAHNPYYISTQYSSMINCGAENCTGSIYTLGGIGLSLISCASECKKAQYIFNFPITGANITIDNFRMDRFEGDSDHSVGIEDCAVCYFAQNNLNIVLSNLYILEYSAVDTTNGNSSIFKCNASDRVLTTTLNNIKYTKWYTGTDNTPLDLWGSNPTRYSVQTLITPTACMKYYVGTDKSIIPYIGGMDGTDLGTGEGGKTLSSTSISGTKTIWLDTKDQYHSQNDTNLKYTGRHHIGDIQLFNDPLGQNALGLSTISVGSESWGVRQIPLVLSGSTSNRPTTNLFNGLMYFDTTLHKPIWRDGSNWYDASGTIV